MLETLDPFVPQQTTKEDYVPTTTGYMNLPTLKHRKPKGKKKTRKALRKTEVERDRLLYLNGQLTHENEMMKRAIQLATAANRRKLDDSLSEDILRLCPPDRSRG